MSLQAKIIFAAALVPCAGLCVWAALAFGGPGTTMMWAFAAIAAGVVVVVWLVPAPRPGGGVPVRVEGAPEPTFNLVRNEPGAKGEVWRLALGRDAFTLIRPDGTVATTLPRAWAILAIQRPGFVRGELLGVATEDWVPPEEERWVSAEALAEGVRSIRKFSDGGGVPCYWFEAPAELVREVGRYLDETAREVGPGVAAPLRVKERRGLRTGFLGLVVGGLVLAVGIASPPKPPARPGDQDPRVRTIVLGAFITGVGLVRLVQGLRARGEARRLSRAG